MVERFDQLSIEISPRERCTSHQRLPGLHCHFTNPEEPKDVVLHAAHNIIV